MKKSLVFSLIAVITVGFGYFVLKNAPAERSQLQKDFEIKISVGREELQKKIISKANTQSISGLNDRDVVQVATSDFSRQDEELIRQAVQAFEERSAGMVKYWERHRLELYRQIGIQGSELADIDEINRFYFDLVRELQQNLGPNLSDEERQQIHEIHTEIFQALDDDIRAYLGADRFEWMKKARTQFNKAFSKHHNSSSEMLAW